MAVCKTKLQISCRRASKTVANSSRLSLSAGIKTTSKNGTYNSGSNNPNCRPPPYCTIFVSIGLMLASWTMLNPCGRCLSIPIHSIIHYPKKGMQHSTFLKPPCYLFLISNFPSLIIWVFTIPVSSLTDHFLNSRPIGGAFWGQSNQASARASAMLSALSPPSSSGSPAVFPGGSKAQLTPPTWP